MNEEVDAAIDLGIDGLSDVRPIGSGGFATVYAATEDRFGRTVAVKVLDKVDAAGRRRFEREQLIMGRMTSHPAVVIPYSSGFTDSGSPYLLMEHLEGGSLGDLVERSGRQGWQQSVDWILPIAAALGHGHAQGILHRDVKPHNILLGPDGSTKLADFGIASVRESAATTQGISFSLDHAAPETFASGNDERDERSDLYSLASSLYQLIDGVAPFHRADANDSQLAYMMRVIDHPAPALTSAPAALGRFVTGALAKDPALRPATAADFAAQLDRARTESLLNPAASPQPHSATSAGTGSPVGAGNTISARSPAQTPTFTPPTPASWTAPPPSTHPQNQPVSDGRGNLRVWAMGAAALIGGAALLAILLAGQTPVEVATPAEVTQEAGDSPDPEPLPDEEPEPATTRSPTDPIVFDDHESAIASMAVLDDGRLVTASLDNTARVWDPKNPDREPVVFDDHSALLQAVVPLSDGRVATSSNDRTVRVWDPNDPALDPIVFAGHDDAVAVLFELADGRLASGGTDRTIHLWDPGFANQPPVVLTGHTKDVSLLTQLSDGRLVSADDGGDIYLWDLANPEADAIVYDGHSDRIAELIELADGRVASASWDATVQIWDSTDPSADADIFTGHEDTVYDLTLLADGRLASGGIDRTVQIWSPDNLSDASVFQAGGYVDTIEVFDDGRIAVGAGFQETAAIRIWPSDDPASTPIIYDGHNSDVVAVALIDDGRVASASRDGTVHVWDPAVVGGS